MSSTCVSETNMESFRRPSYNTADKQAARKCQSLEKEVFALRAELETVRANESWCQQAGERTLQELKRLRVSVPALELERDQEREERRRLSKSIEEISLNLQKEIAERDHWKQNIAYLKEDLDMIELKKMQDLATIEHLRFTQMQTKNMAEQYVINNNTIELENKKAETENDLRVDEKQAAKNNIMYFESERNSLSKNLVIQREQVKVLKLKLDEANKENDELNRQLDIEKEELGLFEVKRNVLKNPFRFQVPGNIKKLSSSLSHKSLNGRTRRTICLGGKSLEFGEGSVGEWFKTKSSSLSVTSAPIFRFQMHGRGGKSQASESIGEGDNSL